MFACVHLVVCACVRSYGFGWRFMFYVLMRLWAWLGVCVQIFRAKVGDFGGNIVWPGCNLFFVFGIVHVHWGEVFVIVVGLVGFV